MLALLIADTAVTAGAAFRMRRRSRSSLPSRISPTIGVNPTGPPPISVYWSTMVANRSSGMACLRRVWAE